MAMAGISLNLVPKCQPSSFQNPTILSRRCTVVVRFFSSSKQELDDEITEKPTSPSSSSQTPFFRDLKESLTHQPEKPPERESSSGAPPFSSSSSSPRPIRKIDFFEEIGKNLSGFSRRSSPIQPRPSEDTSQPPPSQTPSFSEIYNTIAAAKSDATSQGDDNTGRPSFDLIRESFRQLRNSAAVKSKETRRAPDPMSLSSFMAGQTIPGDRKPGPFFGLRDLPESVFGKEMAAGRAGKVETASRQTKYLKSYDYGELGEKLMKLRPGDVSGDNWFSLEELKERLVKLREMEVIEAESRIRASPIDFLKESLQGLDEKSKNPPVPRIDVLSQLGQMGGMRNHLLAPPKAHLVDKYFNPDLMNASEKLKVELGKVREEFRMHESDCGSSSVQIAQLTLRIRYLSVVVHKKDKASQRGLVGLVNARKRHMRYLRRTDWDRYCLVLSKLGLRDSLPKKRA